MKVFEKVREVTYWTKHLSVTFKTVELATITTSPHWLSCTLTSEEIVDLRSQSKFPKETLFKSLAT